MQVTLSLAEFAAAAKELFAEELHRLVGPKGKHDPARQAVRHGSESRFVTLGARLVEIERPRARAGTGRELPLATYAAVANRDLLGEAALARMLAGLSSRRYRDGLEPVSETKTRGISRSAVSRRCIVGTQAKLAQLRAGDLSPLRLLALFIDGIAIGGHTIVAAQNRWQTLRIGRTQPSLSRKRSWVRIPSGP